MVPSKLRCPCGGRPVSKVGDFGYLFERSRDSCFFGIRRIEHPDDAIMKITVQMFSDMVSAGEN